MAKTTRKEATTLREVPTTTLRILRPADHTKLNEQFYLERYVLVGRFARQMNGKDYQALHIALKSQLDQPYKDFAFDKAKRNVVYVLYRKGEDIRELKLPEIKRPLEHETIAFTDVSFFNLLKLLFSDYFRSRKEQTFVSQGHYYVYVYGKGNWHTCVDISFNGDIANEESDEEQYFRIRSRAVRFSKQISQEYALKSRYYEPYYRLMPIKDGLNYFNQVLPEEVADRFDEGIYSPFTRTGRARLEYHNLYRLRTSRGKILNDIINNFVAHLQKVGIEAHNRTRSFTKLAPPLHKPLPLEHLGTIYVYDNRVERDNSLDEFMGWLKTHFSLLDFQLLEVLPHSFQCPVILIQDHQASDFKDNGRFADRPDLHDEVYGRQVNLRTPKQSVSAIEDEAKLKRKMQVVLNQLYLKDVILNERDVRGTLLESTGSEQLSLFEAPAPRLQDYVVIRKKTYRGISFETMLYVEDGKFRLVDLGDEDGLAARDRLLKDFNIDWYVDVHQPLVQKHRKQDKPPEKQVFASYDIIIGHGIAIEIEDIEETVLYNYKEIQYRIDLQKERFPINDFRLAGRFSPDHRDYEKFQQFDEMLDEIEGEGHRTISLAELTRDDWGKGIAEIFGYTFDEEKKRFHRREFLKYYTQKFPPIKAGTLTPTSQGIWYDGDCYLIGDPLGIQSKQDRANLIRRFCVLKGKDKFDIKPLLKSTAVKFIRPERFTVRPFLFKLIDMYVENYSRWVQ